MKTIELIISPVGDVRLETRGFNGSECQNASRFLQTVLGKQTGETLTAEFHQHTEAISTELHQSQ